MFCTQCGHENPADSRYCARCGAPLVPVPAGGTSRPSSSDVGESPVTSTATFSHGGPGDRGDETSDASSAYGDLAPDDQAAVDGLPTACALLVVARGPSSGSRYLLDTEVVTAGRQPDSDIFLDDVTVSRRHAEFRRIDDGFAVRDVGSLNGTYVNRDRIDDVLLSDGDEVQIGKFRLIYFASRRVAGEESARVTRGSAAPSLLSIGEVLAQLRGDFPDVTISKIRFLESLGLVEPVRTPSNYRKFTARDVDRLRYVLAAQRDRFLPLRRIREELDNIERGEPIVEPPRLGGPRAADRADGLPDPESFARDDGRARLTREELLQQSGLDEAMLTAMESYGIVSPRHGTTHYDGDMLAVAQAAAGLAVFGVEARHLRGFRTAAEREIGLIEQLVVPLRRQRATDARGRADVVERELAAACVRLHAALLRAGR